MRLGLGRLAASWRGGPIATSTVCGKRPLTLRITRRDSVGRVAVTVSTP